MNQSEILTFLKELNENQTKFYTCPNFEAFADNKLNMTKKLKLVLETIKNNVKGEKTGYQHFLLFPQCFKKAFAWRLLKVGFIW